VEPFVEHTGLATAGAFAAGQGLVVGSAVHAPTRPSAPSGSREGDCRDRPMFDSAQTSP
jgi:hypothetical protein